MSGGAFDHQDYIIDAIADRINDELWRKEEDREEWMDWYEPETLEEFRKAVKLLCRASVYARRIDYLLSGDDSQDTFRERLKHDLAELDDQDTALYRADSNNEV